jgi:hypothetical protein
MRNRQKSLRRLLAAKSQLHRLEEARLIEIQRGKQVVAEEKRALFDLLGDAEKTDSLLLGLACSQIARADRRERELDAAEKAQAQAVLYRGAQKKALEKAVKESAKALEREDERRLLLDIGEGLASAARTSVKSSLG